MKENISSRKKILLLDGRQFKFSLLSALKLIQKKIRYLNRINFFPIPDKDTGTNLFHTLNTICSGIHHHPDDSIGKIGEKITQLALAGAQGYSGTILAHFFLGFFQAILDKANLNTTEFARAAEYACKAAVESISDPMDGTMTSVIQEWSNFILTLSGQTDNFIDLFRRSLPIAKRSLANTTKILPVLKKAGVVDAGAQGFVYLIEGMSTFFRKGIYEPVSASRKSQFEATGIQRDSDSAWVPSIYSRNAIGIVTDSSCDLPDRFIQTHQVHFIPLKIVFGSQTFLDKIQMTPSEFYRKLVGSPWHPKTSQPAFADVTRLFDEIVPKYNHILSIHIPRAISGTLSVVEKAAQEYGKKITCIDGKNISAALGLVIMEAVYSIGKGLSREKVINRIEQSIENIKIFIVLPTVKYLVKGGRLSKSKGFIGRLLRLNPILSFDTQGHIVPLSKAFGNKTALKKAFKIAQRAVKDYKRIKIMIAHADAPVKARWVSVNLSRLFQLQEEIEIVEVAPVLGVHVGPGTVGFGFIGYHQ